MTIAKVNNGTRRISAALNTDGSVNSILALVEIGITENGLPTTVGLTREIDLWPQLTAVQQTTLQGIISRLSTLASSTDVPLS